ncbi:MAG: oxidoreductase [Limimaricola sp.]|uniref:proton-conducting transporter transmembrane domain-containing protein n=1 Tax=Limimaricola sp. TaxID=2211665 RepID=UPI001E1263C2|nr:proton-conducting transporter membrane subunit [Limimaricola sp.]MBI1418263.1 oxidoreductase [Limimaricola sp.]
MTLLPLLGPALLILTGLALIGRPVPRASRWLRLPEWVSLASLVGFAVTTVGLVLNGPATSALIGGSGVGLSVRVDPVSMVMGLLVSFMGWAVTRFAATYTDGETGQSAFMGRLCLALAAVLALVSAGNLVQLVIAWVAIGAVVNRLLLFYPDRPAARRAARKKSLTGLASSAAVLVAAACLAAAYRTTDIATILSASHAAQPVAVFVAAALLALGAALKSALAPSHGWLTEVMEAPTPVSALLHAGIVNAGGFLLIRFADVLLTSPGAMAALVILGGFSAALGGAVMLTQPAVKTALAWSTLAQMGFMVMQCGLGLFSMALLHIVAHSFYKAHAFLGAGGAVEAAVANRRPGPVAVPGMADIGRSLALSLALFAVAGSLVGIWHEAPQALALGLIVVMGLAYLVAQGLAGAAPRGLTLRLMPMAAGAALSYVLAQAAMAAITHGTLPMPPAPGPLEWLLLGLALGSFALIALAQLTFPLWAGHPAVAGLRVHLMNGLYLNAVFDRWTGGWERKGRA